MCVDATVISFALQTPRFVDKQHRQDRISGRHEQAENLVSWPQLDQKGKPQLSSLWWFKL